MEDHVCSLVVPLTNNKIYDNVLKALKLEHEYRDGSKGVSSIINFNRWDKQSIRNPICSITYISCRMID